MANFSRKQSLAYCSPSSLVAGIDLMMNTLSASSPLYRWTVATWTALASLENRTSSIHFLNSARDNLASLPFCSQNMSSRDMVNDSMSHSSLYLWSFIA